MVWNDMRIAVIGAGNGGQAISAYLSWQGAQVNLYDYDPAKVAELNSGGNVIELCGQIEAKAEVHMISSDMASVVNGTEMVIITTTANAHRIVARQLSGLLQDGQVVILSPGRTGGALEFRRILEEEGSSASVYVAEAQTLVYACRLVGNGKVNIIGVKDKVLLSALPASDTPYVLSRINKYYPCFVAADNVLRTSLENIGAIFHPTVLLFNAATVERQDEFWFYRDMTPQVADFIERFDAERLAVGKAYGIDLLGVSDWITYAYPGTEGTTLCDKMKNNAAYRDIKSPSTIFTRQLLEDIPTGVLPIMELGKAAGLEMPLMSAMVEICSALLNLDLKDGRTLSGLGLNGLSLEEILEKLS